MYTPAGSIVTYQFKADTSLSHPTGQDIEQSVASVISANGFTVVDYNIDASFANILASAGVGYTVQITMKVRTGAMDYGSELDVGSILDNAVYQATGLLPASTIPNVQVPKAITVTPTGAPSQTAPGSGADTGGSSSSFFDGIAKYLEGAGTGAILGIGLTIVAIVLLVGWADTRKLI